jgi:acetylornithine deacetylase/succinyl-diaminopimelate desuccinylase-like protein
MTEVLLPKALGAINRDRLIEIARVLCSIPSPGMGEGLVAESIANFLDRPGIELHVEPVVPGRSNLIATVRGRDESASLILNGHTDASVHDGGWSHDPYDPWIVGNRMYGGGISDMKGAVASMVAAVEAAASLDSLPGDLVLHAVMNHDTVGLGTKYIMASEGPWENCYGICGEPSSLEIHTGNGGAVKFEIVLTGREAHISRSEEGIDTLAAAHRIYDALKTDAFSYEAHPRLPDLPRLLVGMIHGGAAPGSVAGATTVQGDLRIVPGMDRTTVRADLERIVAQVCPHNVQSKVRLNAVQHPFLGVTDGPLIDSLVEVHTLVRGTAPQITSRLPGQAFVTDAADMVAAGIPSVVYGPADWHYAPDEFIDIDEMTDAARIYLGTAIALAGK